MRKHPNGYFGFPRRNRTFVDPWHALAITVVTATILFLSAAR